MAKGHAIVRGQAFTKTLGGDVKYAAGNPIFMVAATPYTKECLDLVVNPGYQTNCLGQLKDYVRSATADGQGNFEFDDVPPGEYIVHTLLLWQVPGPYGLHPTGGVLRGYPTVKSDTDVVTVYVQ